jgi:hypothetical protein
LNIKIYILGQRSDEQQIEIFCANLLHSLFFVSVSQQLWITTLMHDGGDDEEDLIKTKVLAQFNRHHYQPSSSSEHSKSSSATFRH